MFAPSQPALLGECFTVINDLAYLIEPSCSFDDSPLDNLACA